MRPLGWFGMGAGWALILLAGPGFAQDSGAPWKNKAAPEWNQDEARQVIEDSPWAHKITPTLSRPNENGGMSRGGMGRGGIGIGGIGIGLPGMGGRYPTGGQRRGYPQGGGSQGGRYPQDGGSPQADGRYPQDQDPGVRRGPGSEMQDISLRWESAMPVRLAELKVGEADAPLIDEAHYALALYGIPNRMVGADAKALSAELKKNAVLKREGKKDLKCSSVIILPKETGAVIVFLFPRSAEILKTDHALEFDAQIRQAKFADTFYPDQMLYQGKLEL